MISNVFACFFFLSFFYFSMFEELFNANAFRREKGDKNADTHRMKSAWIFVFASWRRREPPVRHRRIKRRSRTGKKYVCYYVSVCLVYVGQWCSLFTFAIMENKQQRLRARTDTISTWRIPNYVLSISRVIYEKFYCMADKSSRMFLFDTSRLYAMMMEKKW